MCMSPVHSLTDLRGLLLSRALLSDLDPVGPTLRRLGALVGQCVFDVLAGPTREGGGGTSRGEEPECGEVIMALNCNVASIFVKA